MDIQIESGNNMTCVTISGSCTIFEAADLRARLLPLVRETLPVMVDVSAISEIDCAGLQVLLALQKESALALFTQPGPALQQALDLLNLNRCFSIEA